MENVPHPDKKKTKRTVHNTHCCVINCLSRKQKNKDIHFHAFPKEGVREVYVLNTFGKRNKVDRRQAWVDALLMERKIVPHMRVCSLHFQEADYCARGKVLLKMSRPKLKVTAVPSRNLPKVRNKGKSRHGVKRQSDDNERGKGRRRIEFIDPKQDEQNKLKHAQMTDDAVSSIFSGTPSHSQANPTKRPLSESDHTYTAKMVKTEPEIFMDSEIGAGGSYSTLPLPSTSQESVQENSVQQIVNEEECGGTFIKEEIDVDEKHLEEELDRIAVKEEVDKEEEVLIECVKMENFNEVEILERKVSRLETENQSLRKLLLKAYATIRDLEQKLSMKNEGSTEPLSRHQDPSTSKCELLQFAGDNTVYKIVTQL